MLVEKLFVIPADTNGSEADFVQMGGAALYRIVIPEGFEGTTIQIDEDWLNSEGQRLHNGSGAISHTVAAGTTRQLLPGEYPALRGVRIIAGTVQSEERVLVLVGADLTGGK